MFENSTKFMKTLLRAMVFGPMLATFPGAVVGSVNPLSEAPAASQDTPAAADGQSSGTGTEPSITTPETPAPVEPVTEPGKPVEPVAPQPTDVLTKLGLDKFKNVEALGNSYKHIEQLHSRTANENAQLKQQLAEMKAQTEAAAAQQQQPAAPELTPEQLEEDNNALIEQLMNDPQKVLNRLRQEAADQAKKELESIKQQVEPIIEKSRKQDQQEQWNQKANEFATAVDPAGNLLHPEISRDEVRAGMIEAFNKFPGLAQFEDGFATAYKFALGELNDTVGSTPAINPSALLDNDDFIKQAASNPKIMELATQKYLESIKSGNPPPIMGASVGSSPSALPENKPKSIAEGSKAFMKALGW